MFKGVDFFPHGTTFPIMQMRRYFVTVSLVAALGAIALLATQGLNFGIDFKGGSLFEIQTKSGNVDVTELRDTLGGLGLGEVQIQELDTPTEALIRVETQQGGETACPAPCGGPAGRAGLPGLSLLEAVVILLSQVALTFSDPAPGKNRNIIL